MSTNPSGPRVAIFTHDAYGLGHVRRCLHIVNELAERAPQAAILLITGCPSTDIFRSLPPNADYLKIPTIVTSGGQAAKPPVLGVGLAELSFLRGRIIRAAVDAFGPDVFLVDNFPLGSRLELLPTLKELRQRSTHAVVGLRDVVDPPEKVRADWARDGIYEVLERYYDRILVYGVREVLDIAEAYALPPGVREKVHYCGYVTATAPPSRSPAEVRAELGAAQRLVLATVGGGGDGFPMLKVFLQALPLIPDISALIVTGEFMNPADRAELQALADGRPGLVIRDYLRDLPCYMAAADVVVAMGGYNTAAEILALGCRTIMVPRTWRSGEHANRDRARADAEQLVRAQALENMGLVDLLHPAELNPEHMAQRIAAALASPKAPAKPSVDVRGVERVAEHILGLANGEEEIAGAAR